MGKWADRYLKESSEYLQESTANSCQKPKKVGNDPLLSVIGSGFVPTDKKNTFSIDKTRKTKTKK